jgi:excisionase family DNA binding protein
MNKLLSPSQVGKIVNRDRKTVCDWIKKYQLPATALPSGQYLIRADEFEAWLRQRNCKMEVSAWMRPSAGSGEK